MKIATGQLADITAEDFRAMARERPFTGSKARSPRSMAASGTPAASAQAVAASALRTL